MRLRRKGKVVLFLGSLLLVIGGCSEQGDAAYDKPATRVEVVTEESEKIRELRVNGVRCFSTFVDYGQVLECNWSDDNGR